jgi:hypothetical protein
VLVPDRDGAYSVAGKAYHHSAFSFSDQVRDDGLLGDERANDGVYSVTIDVPGDADGLEYRFYRNGVAELAPLPPLPSTFGARMIEVPKGTVGAVDVFGETFLMAERTHPDAEGQAVIAKLIAEGVEALPSFRRFVKAAADTDERR